MLMYDNDDNMRTTCWPFQNDFVDVYGYWNGIFTPDECEFIIDYGSKAKFIDGFIHEGIHDDIVDKTMNDSKVSFFNPHIDKEMHFVYSRLAAYIKGLNDRYFNFDISGLGESIQFTKYESPTGFAEKHIDKMYCGVIRKLSVVVQLSDPETYEGGELGFSVNNKPNFISREQGKLIVFPSYIVQEITPVTKGTKYNLNAWVTGNPFK